VVGRADNPDKITRHKPDNHGENIMYYHRYRMVFEGANDNVTITGDKEQKHYYNFFIGNDPSKWKSNIYPNLSADYKNLYNGIDLHVSSASEKLKYDFIVQPGADAAQIVVKYEGADGLKVKNGKLLITTSVGVAEEEEPFAFQYTENGRKEVKCKYALNGNKVTYVFPNGYDHNLPLIIDPTVTFATFSGSSYDNWGFTATYDAQGNFYAGGITSPDRGGTGFNVTTGAFQTSYGGGSNTAGGKYPCDMSIAKYSANGSALIYATYMGGISNEQPHSIIVDALGNLIICGRTYSLDYPTLGGCFDQSYNGGGDIVITKLNAAGSVLLGSTFVGGTGDDGVNFNAEALITGGLKHNFGDDARSEVIVDQAGNIYVAACTKSTDFPVTANAHQNTLGGGSGQDAVVFKMDAGLNNLVWSTYLGGSADDAAYVLALNRAETQLFVAGGTLSNSFPSTGGAYLSSYQGSTDGYILRFQNGGNYTLQRGTFIGTTGYDQCYGIQLDDQDDVYVMGQTLGGTFPVSAGVYSVPNSSQFVMKLDNDLNTNILSTVYGSGTSTATNISPVAFLVDTCQNIYISGWGGDLYTSAGRPLPPGIGNTNGMPLPTPGNPNQPAQATTDGKDFYFIVFSKNMQTLLYSTYMGGVNATPEHVDGGTSRFDKNGVVYQAICGGCNGSSTFPVVNAYSSTNRSANCNLIALKIEFNLGAVNAQANASPNTVVCLGDPINFSANGSTNAVSYEWLFGDGNSSTLANPTHTYLTGGTFNVRMIAVNPNACKTRDTVTLTVKVDTNNIKADFTIVQTDSCKPYTATITNTSKTGSTPTASYHWTFGDNTNFNGANPPVHSFPDTGTYVIRMIMTDPNACNSPDTVTKTISFNNSFVKAGYEGPEVVCVGVKAQFTNRSTNAASYSWSFGDGKGSTESNPVHIFDTAGTFTVKLKAINPKTCNGVDSISKTIIVNPIPIANFTHYPVLPATNEPITFTNLSQFATEYVWDFGDGTFSNVITPLPRLFKKTGTYTVCLQAISKEGCSDTFCRKVDADVYPLADVPTGFTPNGDGNNDILYIRGAGIDAVDFRITNRWGEMVFETKDISIGWDGKYKGKEAPVEAYAYTLNVTFIDGTTFSKQGNITLIR
jgi:gliding motility-associated-like protein